MTGGYGRNAFQGLQAQSNGASGHVGGDKTKALSALVRESQRAAPDLHDTNKFVLEDRAKNT